VKITSQDCKGRLDALLPATYGQSNKGWKRVSKTGTAATQIFRVFHHRALSVVGTVIEQNGVITSVEFQSMGEASADQGKTGDSPVSKGSASADQFLFAFVNGRGDGLRHIAICPLAFWNQHYHMSDEVNRRIMERLLPEDCQEEAEGFFCSPTKKAELRKTLLTRGFKEDPGFTDFVSDL